MPLPRLVGAAGLAFAPIPTLYYVLRETGRLPPNNPRRFVERGMRRPDAKVVACLGASIIHGSVSHNIVDMLDARLSRDGFQLVNAGLNGDLAYNARERLPDVIACRPDVVVVLVGTNDILSTLSPWKQRFYRRTKHLPLTPTLAWYRENLEGIIAKIRAETTARVALCTLPMVGEDLSSPLNRKVETYNEVVKQVTSAANVPCLPVHDRMVEALRARARGASRPFHGETGLMLKAMVQRYALGESFDAIAASNGFHLLTDGIHLSSAGAAIVADLIEDFVRTG